MNKKSTMQVSYDDLVPDYCMALKHYGYAPAGNTNRYFDYNTQTKQAVSYVPINNAESTDRLAARLINDATTHIQKVCSVQDDLEKVDSIKKCHLELFNRYLDLWKTMIASAREDRVFTDTELTYHEDLIEQARSTLKQCVSKTEHSICMQAQSAYDRHQLKKYHLLFDEALISDINKLIGNIVAQRPTLIVGDKGVAKTQVAKFVMSLYETAPKIISVKGDMMSDELIGKIKYDRLNNSFVFQEGLLLSAMKNGEPILLDEINFGDQAILARLQDILISKAGDLVFIQENDEEPIKITPGFIVFATANEASQRYRHRVVLDPALRDRFDILTRNYPDLDTGMFDGSPETLSRLATSSAVNDLGIMSPHIDDEFLKLYIKLAYITEYLYATPAKDASIEFAEDHVSSIVKEDMQPLLTDCLTPRTIASTVEDCAIGSLPGRKLNPVFLDSLLHSLDQAGSHHNYELAQQVAHMLGIELPINFEDDHGVDDE